MKKNSTLTIILAILLVLVLVQTFHLQKLKAKTEGNADLNPLTGNAAFDAVDDVEVEVGNLVQEELNDKDVEVEAEDADDEVDTDEEDAAEADTEVEAVDVDDDADTEEEDAAEENDGDGELELAGLGE